MSMSFNTLFKEVATYQNDKETTINEQRGRIDAALTELYTLVGDTSPTLTANEFSALIAINTDNTQTAAQTITIPSTVKKIFIVENNSAETLTIMEGVVTGILETGDKATFYTSGTANSLKRLYQVVQTPYTGLVMRPQFQIASPTNKLVYQRVLHDGYTLLSVANGLNAEAYVHTAPDANTTLTLYKNGGSIGTVDILSGQNTGTFTVASNVSFVAGDTFEIQATTANAIGLNYALAIELL